MGDVEAPLKVLSELPTTAASPSQGTQLIGVPDRVPHWIGYIAYDATWCPSPKRQPAHERPADVEIIWLGRYDALLVHDHQTGLSTLVGDDEQACAHLEARLDRDVAQAPRASVGQVRVAPRVEHRRAIEAALEHIAAGDVYQVNLARAWRVPFEGSAMRLWERMREASPVPLGLYLDGGDHVALARTMERFLDWEGPGQRLVSRPIKGTIARQGDRDEMEATDLRKDEKERAEHSMIVDLVRNDLGRVAKIGSVVVEEALAVEPYRGLSHLVSTVACTTRPEVTLTDVLEATFPPGSVTGAPKQRAIDIIESLEGCPRGLYTGCVGFIDRRGGASFAVAIRTAVARRGEIEYLAGGGLVEASIPEKEIAETELKAEVFLKALRALHAEGALGQMPSPVASSRDM